MKSKEYQKQVNAEKLHAEILELGEDFSQVATTKYSSNSVYFILVEFPEDLADNQWTLVDAVVAAHELLSLQDLKDIKNAEIDLHTRELIRQGFQHGQESFSLSNEAQRNWTAIESAVCLNVLMTILEANPSDTAGVLAAIQGALGSMFPRSVSTSDDKEFTFQTAGDFRDFYNYGMGIASNHYMTGRQLKQQVNEAADAAAVAAIEDNR